ncbi:hypothetical protein H6P81_001870 [Aristolochia fimbriata]|uniref:Methyltransferase type 11 domain-containing protein n=1 Tax=Aristolochia fimbriata TaxID=158543 RepID=A0AAV7FBD2_ARIFI|nr:hypothetical protein H6P81_001870 [Aristolochia fimbriata]
MLVETIWKSSCEAVAHSELLLRYLAQPSRNKVGMGEVRGGKNKGIANSDSYLYRDVSSCNTYNYGDAQYWDSRYIHEAGSFDWYQRYTALRPFIRMCCPISGRVLMVGCGNAVISEDMVNDGYEEIVNIDISSVVIEMMKKKYENLPQLKYLQMDVRNMDIFPDKSFDCILDKGTLDSLMCGTNAPSSASQMLEEVNRILKPGGTYMLITYGDPSVRMPHLKKPGYNWNIILYIIPRPGFEKPGRSTSPTRSCMEPVPLTEDGTLPASFTLEDPDSHYIYMCRKMDNPTGVTVGHLQ